MCIRDRYWFEHQSLHDYVLNVRDTFASDLGDQAMHIWPTAFLAILFDLLQQRILVYGGSGVERAARRQAERAGINPTVQVVEWRKADYRYPEGHIPRQIDWRCQWSVKEHVRRYKSGKTVTVRPYIKGPENKPFKLPNERVHQIRR